MFRWRIRRVGVIDLPSLLKKQFVLLGSYEDDTDVDIEEQDVPATVGSIFQKAANRGGRACGRKYGTLAELLAEEDDQGDKIQTEVEDDELYQLFKSFYKKYKNEAVEEMILPTRNKMSCRIQQWQLLDPIFFCCLAVYSKKKKKK